MRVISKKALVLFWEQHANAEEPLRAWYKLCDKSEFANFARLKQTFGSVDKVGKFIVFDIGGNKFRLVTVVHFKYRKIYIRAVLTHKDYDKDYWKRE